MLLYAAAVMSLFVNLCGIIQNGYAIEYRKMRPQVIKKLMWDCQKKGIALYYKKDNEWNSRKLQ